MEAGKFQCYWVEPRLVVALFLPVELLLGMERVVGDRQGMATSGQDPLWTGMLKMTE